jgi:hypothetical protein
MASASCSTTTTAMVEREVRLQKLVTVYITTGLLFMLLPGTFLGVLTCCRSAHSTRFRVCRRLGFRPTDMRRFSDGWARSSLVSDFTRSRRWASCRRQRYLKVGFASRSGPAAS